MNKWISNPAYFKRKIEHSFSSSRNKGDFLCSPLTCVHHRRLPTHWRGGAKKGVAHTFYLRHLRPLCFQTRDAGSPGSQCRNGTCIQQTVQRRVLRSFLIARASQERRPAAWYEGCKDVPLEGYCFVLIDGTQRCFTAPIGGPQLWLRVAFNSEPTFLLPGPRATVTFLRQTGNSRGPLRLQKDHH